MALSSAERSRNWRLAHPDRYAARNAFDNERRKGTRTAYCKTWRQEHIDEKRAYSNQWAKEHRENVNAYMIPYGREWRRDRRRKAVAILGGKCVRCGFDDDRALQIDHRHGGGNQERKAKGILSSVNRVLVGDYGDLQLLCANCNWIKRAENNETNARDGLYGNITTT